MAKSVCPWWLGYLMASPMRRWIGQNPEKLLGPYIGEDMTVLEPGPGMGFFTLPLAVLVGPRGRIVAVDIQPQMLDGLRNRARKAKLLTRIEARLASSDSLQIDDLTGKVDFVLAFAVVHEMPSAENFFAEAAVALRSGGHVFLAEPVRHVPVEKFEAEIAAAEKAGLVLVSRPEVRRSQAAILRKN
jgi:SAM-dependent methyltransferase